MKRLSLKSVDPMVEMQIKLVRMMRFIEQEGHEKAEEIYAKTEEEYSIEKGQHIQKARLKINEEYAKKHNEFKRLEHTKLSCATAKCRQMQLISKQDGIGGLVDTVKERIMSDMICVKRRWKILHLLIMEGLFKLLEPEVVIRCREIDANIISRFIPGLENNYAAASKQLTTLSVDTVFIPNTNLPGVILIAKNGRITLDNTLESRVFQIFQFVMPILNTIFYGTSQFRTKTTTNY